MIIRLANDSFVSVTTISFAHCYLRAANSKCGFSFMIYVCMYTFCNARCLLYGPAQYQNLRFERGIPANRLSLTEYIGEFG